MIVNVNTKSGFWLPAAGGFSPKLLKPGANDVKSGHFKAAAKHSMVALYLSEGHISADAPKETLPPPSEEAGISLLSVREARPWIAVCVDDEKLIDWMAQEVDSKNRQTVIDAIEARLASIDADSFEQELEGAE